MEYAHDALSFLSQEISILKIAVCLRFDHKKSSKIALESIFLIFQHVFENSKNDLFEISLLASAKMIEVRNLYTYISSPGLPRVYSPTQYSQVL